VMECSQSTINSNHKHHENTFYRSTHKTTICNKDVMNIQLLPAVSASLFFHSNCETKTDFLTPSIRQLWQKFLTCISFHPEPEGSSESDNCFPQLSTFEAQSVLSFLTERERAVFLATNKTWCAGGSLVRKHHIYTLRSHVKLQTLFPLFYSPLPEGSISDHTQLSKIEKNIYETTKHILTYLPEQLPEAQKFKDLSLFQITNDPDILVSLLETARDFSLIQALKEQVGLPTLRGTLAEKAKTLCKWLEKHSLSKICSRGTNLLCFPKELCQPTLKIIWLGSNKISQLPPESGSMTDLRELDLHNNRIIRLPAEIGRLPILKILILCINPLEELPAEILNLKLQLLAIKRTPLESTLSKPPRRLRQLLTKLFPKVCP